jgi:hypothetical protein
VPDLGQRGPKRETVLRIGIVGLELMVPDQLSENRQVVAR